MTIQLCSAQQQALDKLLSAAARDNILVLRADDGMGKTTILREVQATLGGALLSLKEFVEAMRTRHPLALEETLDEWLRGKLAAHDCVLVDDLDLLTGLMAGGCDSAYPRPGFLEAPLTALAAEVVGSGKRLVATVTYCAPHALQQRGYYTSLDAFGPADYEALCRQFLPPEAAGRLDYAKIHRFAGHLTAQQLRWLGGWLRDDRELDTQRFIDFLLHHQLASNVDLGEVQKVSLSDLKGVDAVIRSLETNIVLPLENDELASRLQLKPNRGVLLLGPPGTGKTTVGRALAHRLKSKFFLVDGTVISGSGNFYYQIQRVFQAALQNAPSVVFIDDSDVIFESGEELGLYRYLLTMLDGLESESASRVCVMLTAMDVSNLPPALIRSGRIELWLEMHLPDDRAREEILRGCLARLPADLRDGVDLATMAAAAEGLTGADLKRLVEDGKNALAYDTAQGRPVKPLVEYLLAAVEGLRNNKQKYSQAEATARLQRPSRPVYYDFPVG
jgi:AAA+ superfamily predicted ATPase